MKILAIDTSTKILSAGIYIDGKICEYNLEVGPKLSTLLAVVIKRMLDALKLDAKSLDYLTCGLGPGSFTGMRVGLSAMKGLGLAIAKPLIGISTLDVLAMNAQGENRIVIPAVDAKRNLIYSCFYKFTKGGLKKLSPYMLISKEELCKKIKSPSVIFGDALNLYSDNILANAPCATHLDKDLWYPKAHNLINLALGRIKNKRFKDLDKINPVYIYPKECQIKKVKSHKP